MCFIAESKSTFRTPEVSLIKKSEVAEMNDKKVYMELSYSYSNSVS